MTFAAFYKFQDTSESGQKDTDTVTGNGHF